MLGALLLNLFEELMGYPYGGRAFPWLRAQAEHDRLLREDEDILNIITTMVTSGGLE